MKTTTTYKPAPRQQVPPATNKPQQAPAGGGGVTKAMAANQNAEIKRLQEQVLLTYRIYLHIYVNGGYW